MSTNPERLQTSRLEGNTFTSAPGTVESVASLQRERAHVFERAGVDEQSAAGNSFAGTNFLSLFALRGHQSPPVKAYGHDARDTFLVGLGVGGYAAAVGGFVGFVLGPTIGLDPTAGALIGATALGVPFFLVGALARALLW